MWQQAHCNKELKHTWPIQLTDCNKWLQYKRIHTGLAISAKGAVQRTQLRHLKNYAICAATVSSACFLPPK